MIYVLNSKGEPLMPTVRHGRVRHLLRDKKAFIVNYHPFTVQLTKERSNEIQEVALGIDTGYENVGLSATTKDKVLFECKAELRTDLGTVLKLNPILLTIKTYRYTIAISTLKKDLLWLIRITMLMR